MTDSLDKNVLHHAVMKGQADIVKQLVLLDADHGKLRGQKDAKGKTPILLDGKSQFRDAFITVWDAAREGNLEKLKVLVRPDSPEITPWLGNTPLHVAVKAKQIMAVKLLVWDLNADANAQNFARQTPMDLCKKFIQDEAT